MRNLVFQDSLRNDCMSNTHKLSKGSPGEQGRPRISDKESGYEDSASLSRVDLTNDSFVVNKDCMETKVVKSVVDKVCAAYGGDEDLNVHSNTQGISRYAWDVEGFTNTVDDPKESCFNSRIIVEDVE